MLSAYRPVIRSRANGTVTSPANALIYLRPAREQQMNSSKWMSAKDPRTRDYSLQTPSQVRLPPSAVTTGCGVELEPGRWQPQGTFFGRKPSMTSRAAVTPTAVLLTPPKALTRVSARPTHRKSLPIVCSIHSLKPSQKKAIKQLTESQYDLILGFLRVMEEQICSPATL